MFCLIVINNVATFRRAVVNQPSRTRRARKRARLPKNRPRKKRRRKRRTSQWSLSQWDFPRKKSKNSKSKQLRRRQPVLMVSHSTPLMLSKTTTKCSPAGTILNKQPIFSPFYTNNKAMLFTKPFYFSFDSLCSAWFEILDKINYELLVIRFLGGCL